MTSSFPARALIRGVLGGILALTLSACGGSPGSASSPLSGGSGPIPELGQGLTPQTIAFINEKYGHNLELKEVALAWAEVIEARYLLEAQTGVFNEKMALRDAHSQLCLFIKGDRLGLPTTNDELTKFSATFAVTPDRLRASLRSNKLASGHPLRLYMVEDKACRAAKGL
jgi:hypothetical protein